MLSDYKQNRSTVRGEDMSSEEMYFTNPPPTNPRSVIWNQLNLQLSSYKTLYKTQIRELKDEYDEKNKLCKNMQQQLAQYEEER